MKAILLKNFGGVENLELASWEEPQIKKDYIKIKIKAFALNRADILQREGKYPPPRNTSPILGLEVAGEVVEIGENVSKWKIKDKVFGLLPGGAYAEFVIMHKNMAIKKPDFLDFEQATAIPEVFLTAFQALVWLGKLQENEKVLIHAGGSGVGTAAIQIAKNFKSNILITASREKHQKCKDLGANFCIDYKIESFREKILELTEKQGVDLIIDFIGANYFNNNINSLNLEGRLVILAFLGGVKLKDTNLLPILRKRLQIIGSTLRARTLDYQIQLTQDFWKYAQPLFAAKMLKPVIDTVFSWKDIQKAHNYMENNQNFGKIVLRVD